MEASANYLDISVDQRAYRFFRLKQQEKSSFNQQDGRRVYFHGQIEHDDFQKKKLSEFLEFVKQENFDYDKSYFNGHMILIFVIKRIQKRQNNSRYPLTQGLNISEVIREIGLLLIRMTISFSYICGRDKYFKPTIVFNLSKADSSNIDAVFRGIVFTHEEVIEKMLIPGQVESWNVLLDFQSKSFDLAFNVLMSTISQISAHYGGKLNKLWMVNIPLDRKLLWAIVKNFLKAITVDKIKLSIDDSLWELCDKGQFNRNMVGANPIERLFTPSKLQWMKAD